MAPPFLPHSADTAHWDRSSGERHGCRLAVTPADMRAACRYGFVVYQDPNVTDIACAGLNGMRMGERTLTVRRATEVQAPLSQQHTKVLGQSATDCDRAFCVTL